MTSSWTETTIGEQVTLQRGIDITKDAQRTGEVPVVSSGGISSYHDTAAVKGPGVVLGRKGVVGSVWYIKSDFWPHDTTLYVKDFKGNDPRFVYYFFKWKAAELAALDVGSANPTLNRNHVHPMKVRWPSHRVQAEISELLGCLDDKIEANQGMNETLEKLAQANFRSWFVDFDPVHAKSSGKKPFGISEAASACFSKGFEDCELGKIPSGWQSGTAGDVLTLVRESVNPANFPDVLFEHFSIPAFDAGKTPKLELGSAIKSNKFKVEPNDTLVSKLNPATPRVWFLGPSISQNAICSTEFMVARPKGVANHSFLHCLLQSSSILDQLVQTATGTSNSHQRAKPETLLNASVVIPNPEVLKAFSDLIDPLIQLTLMNREETKRLTVMRDQLLPRLMSGEVLPRGEVALCG